MQNDFNETLDSDLVRPSKPNEKREKILLKVGWTAVGLLLIGVLFKLLHWPYSDIFMLSGASILLVVGVLRFYFEPNKTSEVIVQLVVNLLIFLWIFSSLFDIPFRNEIKYITIAMIVIRSIFFRKTQDE